MTDTRLDALLDELSNAYAQRNGARLRAVQLGHAVHIVLRMWDAIEAAPDPARLHDRVSLIMAGLKRVLDETPSPVEVGR